MSTLLSRIFGRKKSDPAKAPQSGAISDAIDVSALRPLMSPQEFGQLGRRAAPATPVVVDPKNLSGAWTMEQVLREFPSAQRALFERYHIGGCNSCGYEPSDTLDEVARKHGLQAGEVVAFVHQSTGQSTGQSAGGQPAGIEKHIEIEPAEVAELLKKGAIKLIDVRTPHEFEIARIDGSQLVDQELAQKIVQTWPKDLPIVTVCHHGVRSLDAAAYFRGHGLRNTQSMRGGIDVWSTTVDPSVPRY